MIVSESTSAWQAWRDRRVRHRRQLSWGSSVLALLLLFLGFWVAGAFHLLSLGDEGPSVAVKLGNPEGEASPLSVTAQPDPVMAFVQQAATASVLEDSNEPDAVPVAKPLPTPAPKPQATPPKTVEKKVDAPPTPPQAATTVIKGAENGNTAQAVFEGTLKGIRKNLQIPIYLYMPLPKALDAVLLDKVQADSLNTVEERRRTLLSQYEASAGALKLKSQPPLEARPDFWVLLMKAGYDATKADYKTERNLKSITLSFKLTPATPDAEPRLTEVKLEKSSGDAEIDAIVKSVFEQYRYSNPTGETVAGKFVYDF